MRTEGRNKGNQPTTGPKLTRPKPATKQFSYLFHLTMNWLRIYCELEPLRTFIQLTKDEDYNASHYSNHDVLGRTGIAFEFAFANQLMCDLLLFIYDFRVALLNNSRAFCLH